MTPLHIGTVYLEMQCYIIESANIYAYLSYFSCYTIIGIFKIDYSGEFYHLILLLFVRYFIKIH